MAKCLVTGGAGFIGSNLVDSLVMEGWEVVVIDDLSTGRKDYLHPQCRFYEADITSLKEVEKVFQKESIKEKIDFVFHLAAQIDVHNSVKDPQLDNNVNVIGGLNVLESCYKHGVDKIIFTSTGGALYDSRDEIPTTENQAPKPISPYGIHKLTFEHYLNYYYQVYGQKYAVLRLANVYGPRQFKGGEAGVITIFIDNAVRRKQSVLYGDGKQTRDFVYVQDVVDALKKVAESDYMGSLNIGRGIEVNILEVIEAIEDAVGEKIKMAYGDFRSGEVRRSCLDAGLARSVLGWKPTTDLMSGIEQTISWSKKNFEQERNND